MTSVNNTLFVNKARNSVGINNSIPRYTLDVIGTMRATSTITAGANIVCSCNIFVNGAQVITSGGTGDSTNFTQSVGIGCNTPRYPLDVNGSANFGGVNEGTTINPFHSHVHLGPLLSRLKPKGQRAKGPNPV